MRSFFLYLINDAPSELKIIVGSGLFGTTFSHLFKVMSDDATNKFLSSLVSVGSLVTMVLACIFWIIKIRKERG